MKASELIKQVQALVDKYGDLPVELCTEKALEQEEVVQVCWGGYGDHTDKAGKNYIALYSWFQ